MVAVPGDIGGMTWVFCAGMIRSGSTLQYQLAAEIVERSGIGRRIEYAPESEFEQVSADVAAPGLRVFKAHVCLPAMERECLERGARVVYSYRDIRDVAVSSVRKFGRTLEQLLDDGWLDQAITDFERWTRLPNVLVSRYEEMAADVEGEAWRIARHLAAPLDASAVGAIAREFTLEAQRERVERLRAQHGERIASGGTVFDPRELLHHNHIHAGEVGGWRRELAADDAERLNRRYAQWLERAGYPSR
jgi:hypothetical protein